MARYQICILVKHSFCNPWFAVPEFSVTRGTTSLNIRFKTNYHVAGPPPQGHEIAVWPVPLTLNTATGPFSHYFELSVQEAVVKNLQPGTGYRLVVRSVASSDGAGSANNYGRWTVQAVRSLPVGGCMHAHMTRGSYMGC